MLKLNLNFGHVLQMAGLAFLIVLSSLTTTHVQAGQVVIGSTPTGHLMWIAEDQGYFEESGSDIVLKEYSSGVTTSKALANGEINLANSSEFAFVNNVLRNRDLKLVASIAKTNSVTLFTRKDNDIKSAQDLMGKKIGVTRRGIGEFFLGEYLSLHGVLLSDVELVDLRPPEIGAKIQTGEVDAAITWEPYVYKTAKALGDNYTALPDQDSNYYHFVLAGTRDWLIAHSLDVQNVLRALIRAQKFAADNPEAAQEIMSKRFNLDRQFVHDTWDKYILEVTLLQNLLSLMEQETNWIIDNHMTDVTTPLDFLDVIHPDDLIKVKPDAVLLIQ